MGQLAATDEHQWQLTASRRSAVYGLLSILFRSEPDEDLVRWIRMPQVFNSLRGAGMELDEIELFAAPVATVAGVLAIDYADLFSMSSSRIALNESAYRREDGAFWTNAATEVGMMMGSIGVTVGQEWDVTPDHISVELELMKTLIDRETAALEDRDLESAVRYRNLQMELMGAHIVCWVPAMCDRVAREAGTLFFRGLATLTTAFILHDTSDLLAATV